MLHIIKLYAQINIYVWNIYLWNIYVSILLSLSFASNLPITRKNTVSNNIYSKTDQWVWCMEKEDKKHPNRPRNKLLGIQQSSR